MRDQAQVQLYCRADPLLLWVRASRLTQGAPLNFGVVSQEQKQLHRFPRVILRGLPRGVQEFYTLSTVSRDQTADREIFFSSFIIPTITLVFVCICLVLDNKA